MRAPHHVACDISRLGSLASLVCFLPFAPFRRDADTLDTGCDDAAPDPDKARRAEDVHLDIDARLKAGDEHLAAILRSAGRRGEILVVPRDADSRSIEIWRLSLDRKRPSLVRPSVDIQCDRASFCVDGPTSFAVRGRTSDGLDFRVVVGVDAGGAIVGWLYRGPRRLPCAIGRPCLVCVEA